MALAVGHAHAVVINEFLAWNHSSAVDENGDYEDWIELYNPAPAAVSLAGYSLTDDPAAPRKWAFPDVAIPGNGFLLLWASEKNRLQPGMPLHTNFRLDRGGEFLGLYDSSGRVADALSFGPQREDVSYGRQPDGSSAWLYFTAPTPLSSNNRAPTVLGFAADPVFTPDAGVHGGVVGVQLATATPGAQIRFTVDGSNPWPGSYLCTGPVYLSATTVIRAQVFAPPLQPSHVVTKTYLFNVGTALPILSLVTDPGNLWGPNGIYYANLSGVAGERPCSVEYWKEGGTPGFAATCGLRMRGGASQSRGDIHKKSFRLDFSRAQGPAKLEYRMFDSTPVDRFDTIALRANYNDSWAHWSDVQRTHAIFVRDELSRRLRLEMGDLAAHGNFCMLYLNGRFWGIYNPCELVGRDFLESQLGPHDWDILSLSPDGACLLEAGDRGAWDSFSAWFASADLSLPGNYQALQSMLDLQNYTDYMIANIVQRNTDWPQRNGYVARARGVPGAKWIALDWDEEAGWGGGPSSENAGVNMMSAATTHDYRISHLLSQLLRNFDYRIYFAQRMDILLNSALDEWHVVQRMNELAAALRWAVPQEGTMPGLYGGIAYTQATWEWALWRASLFMSARPSYVRQHAQGRIPEIQGWLDVTVLPPAGGPGDVLLHTIRPRAYPWTGTFFRGIPLLLTAVPAPGYVFAGWSDPSLPNQTLVAFYPTAAHGPSYSIYARFAPEPTPPWIDSLEFVARNRAVVTFNKPLERAGAETASNYRLDYGLGAPRRATLQGSPTVVVLELGANASPGINYQLLVRNVKSQTGIAIPPNQPAAANALFQLPRVTISELMYDSLQGDVEWVELHNATEASIDIGNWCLTDDGTYPPQDEGLWIFPPATVLRPKEYVVVGLSRDIAGWHFPRAVRVITPTIVRKGDLKNSGDNLALFTAASGGVLVDGSLTAIFPDLARKGRSLEKLDGEFPWSGNPLAWRECAAPLGWNTPLGTHGSPGRENGSLRLFLSARHWSLY